MQTRDIKDFYNHSLQKSENAYEFDRWFKNSQAQASYISTKKAVSKYAIPLINDEMDVFELGPGPGTWTKVLLEKAPKARYDLVDISEAMLEQAKRALSSFANISFKCSDILEFNPTKKYDFFFSSRMIEYVPDKEKAVKVIADSLRTGAKGYIVTKTPQTGRPLKRHTYSDIHKQQIEMKDLVSLLEGNGLRVIKKAHVTCVFPLLRSGFMDRVTTVICQFLPLRIGMLVSESYVLVFVKK